MKNRRSAREATLQALYQCDVLGDWSVGCLELFYDTFFANEDTKDINFEFSKSLITGILSTKDFLDTQIQGASTHWTISRMSLVDRNILRLATFEIFFMADIPTNVSINEAIEIAKKFSTPEAYIFINGVLDRVANNTEPLEEVKIKTAG